MDLSMFIDNALLFLDGYGFLLVIVFGLTHGFTDNPWSFFTLSLALTILNLPIALFLIIFSNYLGTVLLYFVLKYLNVKSDDYLHKKNVSRNILNWLETQPIWKHILVIGMPLVPTIQIRYTLPFTKIGFKKFSVIIIGAYMFLYTLYSLVYYGLLSFITDEISEGVGVVLLILFSAIIYFGNDIRKKLFTSNLEEVIHEN